MKQLRGNYKMRLGVYITYASFVGALLLLIAICQYLATFFSAVQSLALIFRITQVVGVVLISALLYIVYVQYKKAGHYSFYEEGIIERTTNTVYYYNDIVRYSFVPSSNGKALAINFFTDDNQQGTLLALLPPETFTYFQKDHAAIWTPFMLEQIANKLLVSFTLEEDVTSFKMQATQEDKRGEIVFSEEGIVLYHQFYPYSQLSRYHVSYLGMVSIYDTDNRAIFLEPKASIMNYQVFINLLAHFVSKEGSYGKKK